ncbi:MAG: hypothetical protein WBL23_09385 [Salinisphaera sp.]|uniref:hypothetical protein n=1 Tax=Salinisphaera sp. TaxID=1914330 RepID=UPI003C7B707C
MRPGVVAVSYPWPGRDRPSGFLTIIDPLFSFDIPSDFSITANWQGAFRYESRRRIGPRNAIIDCVLLRVRQALWHVQHSMPCRSSAAIWQAGKYQSALTDIDGQNVDTHDDRHAFESIQKRSQPGL